MKRYVPLVIFCLSSVLLSAGLIAYMAFGGRDSLMTFSLLASVVCMASMACIEYAYVSHQDACKWCKMEREAEAKKLRDVRQYLLDTEIKP